MAPAHNDDSSTVITAPDPQVAQRGDGCEPFQGVTVKNASVTNIHAGDTCSAR